MNLTPEGTGQRLITHDETIAETDLNSLVEALLGANTDFDLIA